MSEEYTEDQLPGLITSWKLNSETWRMPVEDKCLRLYKKYRLYLDLDETYFWESKVFIPEAFTIVWTAIPKMIKSLLDQEPYIKMRPLKQSAVEGSRIAEALLTEQIKQINFNGLYTTLITILQDLLIYGNAFFDETWKIEEAFRRKREAIYREIMMPIPTELGIIPVPVEVFDGYETTTKQTVIYDGPEIKPVDWFDVYPDPNAIGIHARQSRFVVHREIMNEEDVDELNNRDGYKNLKAVRFTYDGQTVSNYDQKKQIDEVINTFGTHGAGGQKQTEILKCQWRKKVKNHYEEWLTVISDGNVVVYNDRSPYYHDERTLHKADCMPLTNRMYAVGLLEPSEDLQDAINHRFNQMSDIVTMALSPMLKTSMGAYERFYEMFGSAIPSIPGLMLPLSNNEDIGPVFTAQNIRPAQEEIAYIKDIIEESTASPQISKGVLPDRKETATGLALAQNQAGERFITIMNIFFYTALRPMANQILQLNFQFKDLPFELEVENEQGVKEFRQISMEDIPEDGLAMEPNMSFIDPLVSRDLKAKTLMDVAVAAANTPAASVIKWPAIMRQIFKLRLPNVENDSLLHTDEELQQMQQQEAELMQVLQGQEGGQPQLQGPAQ